MKIFQNERTETHGDVISRQAAIDELDTVGYDFSESGFSEVELIEVCEAVGYVRQDMISRIKKMPSAQPERKTGKWIYDNERGATGIYAICTSCNEAIYQAGEFNYCPNCGAKMMEVEA